LLLGLSLSQTLPLEIKDGKRAHVAMLVQIKERKKWPRGTVGEIRRDIYQSRILLENCFISEFR
jgi:hypothetical protein